MNKPNIETKSDYDNYFTAMVQNWCEQKITPFKSKTIEITAGPYRMNAVTAKRNGSILQLDFYSALRNGSGKLGNNEVEEIIKEWV